MGTAAWPTVWTLPNENSHCYCAWPEPKRRAVPQLGTELPGWWISGNYGDYAMLIGQLGKPECEAECRLLSPTAKIPSIHSFEEDMEVRDMAGAWLVEPRVWLGATKNGESRDTYVWDDGSQWSYTAFAEWGDPQGAASPCLLMYMWEGEWLESHCDDTYTYCLCRHTR